MNKPDYCLYGSINKKPEIDETERLKTINSLKIKGKITEHFACLIKLFTELTYRPVHILNEGPL
jgi:hypothetical protein